MKKRYISSSIIVAATTLILSNNAFSSSFGENITAFDGKNAPIEGPAYGNNVGYENNEAEPGMVQSQAWDLEGFFVNYEDKTLTMVGGYDFINGKDGYLSGDIFISTDETFGDYDTTNASNGYFEVQNNFGYEYVLDVDWNNGKFDLLELQEASTTKTVYYGDNKESNPDGPTSNPYRYVSDGIQQSQDGEFSSGYFEGEGAGFIDTPFSDWGTRSTYSADKHYWVTFDLTSLVDLLDFNTLNELNFHFTMGCGNDNLMGNITDKVRNLEPVPEPATMLLFGTGLAGLAGIRRRRKK